MPTTITPLARIEPVFIHQFAMQLAQTQAVGEFGGRVDIAFLGDSLLAGMTKHESWWRVWKPRRSLNLGVGGDQTGHLLFRLQNGLLDPIKVQAVVQMIGVNNFVWGKPDPDQIALGVDACLGAVRRTQPNARILCLGLLPLRGGFGSMDAGAASVNSLLHLIAAKHNADFVDLRPMFIRDNEPAEALYTDGCHLSANGNAILTEAVLEWIGD